MDIMIMDPSTHHPHHPHNHQLPPKSPNGRQKPDVSKSYKSPTPRTCPVLYEPKRPIVLDFLIRLCYDIMFVFEMPKVVHIRNPALGFLFRSVQMFILTYFVLFVMWWNKGYQSFERSISGVSAQVNGIAWIDSPYWRGQIRPGFTVYDNGEYELQMLQNSGFYLITRIHGLHLQNLTKCPETSRLPDARCSIEAHCPVGGTAGQSATQPDGREMKEDEIDLDVDANGIFTGRCVTDTGTCEIYGWCPADFRISWHVNQSHHPGPYVIPSPSVLQEPYSLFNDLDFIERRKQMGADSPNNVPPFFDMLNYTIFIKNAIEFPNFDVKRRNILPWMTEIYLKSCLFDPDHERNKYCPVFRVGDMIRMAKVDPDRLLYFGGVMAITINWQCDLDWSVDYCLPSYSFRQLDDADMGEDENPSSRAALGEGSMLKSTLLVKHGNTEPMSRQRTLLHATGITFIIRATGKAGKFNLLSFTMRFGSGLALLGGATILCDLIAFHILHDRAHYKKVTCDDSTLKELLQMASMKHFSSIRSAHIQMLRKDNTLTVGEGNSEKMNSTVATNPPSIGSPGMGISTTCQNMKKVNSWATINDRMMIRTDNFQMSDTNLPRLRRNKSQSSFSDHSSDNSIFSIAPLELVNMIESPIVD